MIWAAASQSRLGITIQTSDPAGLLNLLLEARKALSDPDLWQFSLQAKENAVWLVRNKGATVKVNGAYRPLEE